MKGLKMKRLSKEHRENLANQLAKEAYGHYLDRMLRAAQILDREDIVQAVYSVKSLYAFSGCQPKGMMDHGGILWIISLRIMHECEERGFSKAQLNKLYYVLVTSCDLDLTPPKELITNEARANT